MGLLALGRAVSSVHTRAAFLEVVGKVARLAVVLGVH